jgi:hypothetical protein
MPNNLELKILPRMNYWPKTFEQICPVYDDVALIFSPVELDWYVYFGFSIKFTYELSHILPCSQYAFM